LLARDTAWVIVGRLVGIAATLVGNVVAARLLGPEQFGIYLLLSAVMVFGATFGMAGLNEAGLRFVSHSLGMGHYGTARSYLRTILVIAVVTTLLACALTASGLALFAALHGRLLDPWLSTGLVVTGLVALAFQQIAAEMLRGWHDLRRASLFSGGQTGGPLSNLLFLAAIAVAVLSHVRVNAVLALGLTVVSVALTAPIALAALWRVVRRQALLFDHGAALEDLANATACLSTEQTRELVAVAGALWAMQLLAFVSQQLDLWIGGVWLTDEQLGLYGAAKRSLLLAAMPVQIAMLSVVASIPRLYAQNRRRELEQVLRGSATIAALAALLALAALVFFPGPVLRLVFGPSYSGAAPYILVLAVGHLALVLSGNPVHTLALTGHHRTALAVNVFTTVLLAVGGWWGARWFGAQGLAVAAATSLALQSGLLWYLARKKVGIWTHAGWLWALPWNKPAAETRGGAMLVARQTPPELDPAGDPGPLPL
jgi:O-antigen/teichoic acid export membrane protein